MKFLPKNIKWVNCKTCYWDSQDFKKQICKNCSIKNKNMFLCSWKNDKINDTIRDICVENNWKEFDNDKMYSELMKLGVL